jgi:5-methylcytosine-specific restriction endonuclease McrA
MLDLDHYRTLILDSAAKPVKIVAWQKGVIYDLQNKVIVLESYDRIIRSTSFELFLPAVVMLRHYVRVRPYKVRWSKRNVFSRDDYTCQFCGCQPGQNNLTIDHVLPSSRGGRSTWTNTVAACSPCNHRKGDRLPAEAGMPLNSKPSRPEPTREGLIGPRTAPAEWAFYLSKAG